MSIYQMTQPVLDRDFHWLFDAVADAIDAIVEPLGTGKISLPAIPRRMGVYVVPYTFAGRIQLMLDYACEKQSLSRDYVLETSASLCKMLTLNVTSFLEGDVLEEDDDDDSVVEVKNSEEAILARFIDHPIIQVVLAARGRLAIIEKRHLTALEFKALTGLSATRAKSVGIQAINRPDGVIEYDSADVVRVLKNVDSSSSDE